MSSRRSAVLAALLFALPSGGCGGESSPVDAGVPAPDAGGLDASALDASTVDAGVFDAGVLDDASQTDAQVSDGGAMEVELTLLSLNLHCLFTDGTPYADNAARFAVIADVVAREGVDVLALQEVCDDGVTDALEALRSAVAARTSGSWESHAVFAHRAWVGTAAEADESVALIARSLSTPRALVHRAPLGFRRVAASAAVGGVRVTSVHFDAGEASSRRSQAREVAVAALAESYPSLDTIVAGDINARTGAPSHAAFLAQGYTLATEDVSAGLIDHVYVPAGSTLEVLEVRRLFADAASRVSDHPGLLVRFARAPRTAPPLTRVVAEAGADTALSIRGSVAPLSWDEGWPMHRLDDAWHFVTPSLSGAVAFKTLIDDTSWQLGDDVTLVAGDDVTITPAF